MSQGCPRRSKVHNTHYHEYTRYIDLLHSYTDQHVPRWLQMWQKPHWTVCDWTQRTTEPLKCVTEHNAPLSHWNVCDWTQRTIEPLKCAWLNTTHLWATEMCVTGHNTPLSHWNVRDWTQRTTEPLKCVWLNTTHHWATEICVTEHNTPLSHWNVCDWTQHATEICVTEHNTPLSHWNVTEHNAPLSHWNVCDWTQHTTEPLKCVWLDTTHHCATEMCVTEHNTPLCHWNDGGLRRLVSLGCCGAGCSVIALLRHYHRDDNHFPNP
jgi:hypothetical protein